jgi:dihydrolipoamide dehydrogenase
MGTEFLMKKNKIATFRGIGRLTAPGTVQIEGEQTSTIRATNIVLCNRFGIQTDTGLDLEGPGILTNKEILDLESVPKSLIIIGAARSDWSLPRYFRDLVLRLPFWKCFLGFFLRKIPKFLRRS